MMRLSAAAGLILLASTSLAQAQDFDFNVITEEKPAVVEDESGEEEVGKITVSGPPGTVNVTEEVKKSAEPAPPAAAPVAEVEEEPVPETILWAETPSVEEAIAPETLVEETKPEVTEEAAPVVEATPEPPTTTETVKEPAVAAPSPVPAPVPTTAPAVISSPTPQSWTSPAARAKSPYERNRVVPRIELDGSLPQPKIGAPFTALGPVPNAPIAAPMAAPAASAPVVMPVPPAPAPVRMAAAPLPQQAPATIAPTVAAPVATPVIENTPPATPAIATQAVATQVNTGSFVTLSFEGNKSDLGADAMAQIDGLISQMTQNPALRLQVRAFATAPDGSEMTAKRVALSRVLAVRSYMLEKGIAPLRIDVRPLGLDSGDRVELEFID